MVLQLRVLVELQAPTEMQSRLAQLQSYTHVVTLLPWPLVVVLQLLSTVLHPSCSFSMEHWPLVVVLEQSALQSHLSGSPAPNQSCHDTNNRHAGLWDSQTPTHLAR